MHLRKVTSKPGQTDRFPPPSDAAGCTAAPLPADCAFPLESHRWAGVPYSVHTITLQAMWDRDGFSVQTIPSGNEDSPLSQVVSSCSYLGIHPL